MVQDETVSTSGPREGGPRRRRAFSTTETLQHLTAYEQACAAADGGGGAYLREQVIYSSQITQWRQLRDAGLLAGEEPGGKGGRATAGAGGDRSVDAGAGTQPTEVDENGSGPSDHGKSSRLCG